MTDNIAAFIRARLDEDQAMISRNSEGAGLADGFPDYRTYTGPDADAADDYISHFGPARVLRGVEAKRKALALHAQGHECPSEAEEPNVASWYESDCPTIRAVASEWSTHPDYRQEWTP